MTGADGSNETRHSHAAALPRLACIEKVTRCLAGSHPCIIDIEGPWGAAKSLVAAQLAETVHAPLLVVTPGRIDSEAAYDDFVTWLGPHRCLLLPAWEVLPHEMMDPADDIIAERFDTFIRLAEAAQNAVSLCVVAPVRALLQLIVPPDDLMGQSLRLAVGEEHDLESLLERLTDMGYERDVMVEQRGQISVRGGILDIFPTAAELPYRLEFFGDTVESIRRFEPETQRSVAGLDAILVSPRSEKHLIERHADRLVDISAYLPPDTLAVLDEPLAVKEEAEKALRHARDDSFLMPWDRLWEHLRRRTVLSVSQLTGGGMAPAERISVPTRSLTSWAPPATDFWSQLELWAREKYTVLLLCANTGERQRMLELIEEHGHRPTRDGLDLRVGLGRIRTGFVSQEDRLAVLSEREVFGRRPVRRARRRFEAGAPILAFCDLRAGDFVVHAHHGIGRYLGLRRFPDKTGDFLSVEYAGGDKFYVPATRIDLIQEYIGGGGAVPKLDRLGGATWARTRARVKKALRDLTDQLVALYAARSTQDGHAFPRDTPWQAEFEDAFEYDETPDQARAIIEVKRDMEQPRPMDRLLCGDVGFGKTEVALRAAFKAVQDAKQVAVLVPTTILAEQHYTTFTQRLADYPVRIELLCRFRSAREQKRTIERLKSGEVDIVVGTHRLLSCDIEFKDLGLLVLDEEHRFGVAQKERLKRLRVNVDVLTMTATPIPRTLNLSLLGVRDMSIINTAPNDRLPVHTCIHTFDERVIREAIERELAREGQCFFVHNRVQSIQPYAELVRRLVPEARTAIGHGQMPEKDLETVMARFIHHEIDVLVCTTIIGSGLDIPNANTIIINHADQFGVSELYQLRGRVGRYKHRAFAYLLVSGDRALSEDAQKRLKALEEFSALGSGFRIAMRDMEIRGCGNILGAEQHGHIAAVGYDTYCELIAEAVAETQGRPIFRRALPPFDIAVDALIPEEYVPSETQKITLYKRIAAARTVEEVDEMAAEIADRFGKCPAPVRRLLGIMRARALGADVGAARIAATRTAISIDFESGRAPNRRVRAVLNQQFGPRLSFTWNDPPRLTYQIDAECPEGILSAVQHILHALGEAGDPA